MGLAWVGGRAEVVWVVLLKQSGRLYPAGVECGDGRGDGCELFLHVAGRCACCRWNRVRGLDGDRRSGRAVLGIIAEGEPASLVRVGCVCLILAGVAGLKLGG